MRGPDAYRMARKALDSMVQHKCWPTPQNYELWLFYVAILEKVWGPAYRDEVHLLRVNIARLRRKIEADARQPQYVRTHARAGYSLATL